MKPIYFIALFLICFLEMQSRVDYDSKKLDPPKYLEKHKSFPEGRESDHSGEGLYSTDGSDLVSVAFSSTEHTLTIKFEEGNLSDALVTRRMLTKVVLLAKEVEKEWVDEGVYLRITEAWDTEQEHSDFSLHYEGRAIDFTTSDKDLDKLSRLGGLAIGVGFDWVYNEGNHIHASVIR